MDTSTDTDCLISPVDDKQQIQGSDSGLESGIQIKKPKRSIVVEPLLIIYIAAGFPVLSLYQQYFYIAVGKSMGINVQNLSNVVGNVTDECDTNRNDSSYIDRERVQAASAQYTMYISLATIVPITFANLFYGTLSDKYGRKLLLILPCIGSSISTLIQMSIIYFELPLYVYYIDAAVSIFFGSFELLFVGCYSYIADTVPPEKRGFRITVLDGLMLPLGSLANLGVGYWISAAGYFQPYFFVLGGKLLALAYAIFFIPETVQKTSKSKYSLKDIRNAVYIFTQNTENNRRWKILLLTFAYMTESLFSTFGIFTLFEMNTPLCWGAVLIAYFMLANETLKAVVGISASFLRRWLSEAWLAVMGKSSYMLSYIYLAFVVSTPMMFLVPILGMFSLLSVPMTKTMLSNQVASHEQGSLFAALSCFYGVASLINSVTMQNVYASSVSWWPGFVFMLGAGGVALGLVAMLVFIFKDRKVTQKES